MKKKLFTMLAAAALSAAMKPPALFAETEKNGTSECTCKKELSMKFQNGMNIETGTAEEPFSYASDFLFQIERKSFSASTGIKMSGEALHSTLTAEFLPEITQRLSFGPAMTVHYQNYYRYFSEFDFLAGMVFRHDTRHHFSTRLSVMYLRKGAKIKIDDGRLPWLYNNNMAMGFSVEVRPCSIITLNLDLASYSYYRYMLFLAPDISLKISLRATENFSVGIQSEIQYVDMFTLSANFNWIGLRTFVNVEL